MKAITPELVRAESALLRQDKAWRESLETHSARWEAKRHALITSLEPEVREALVALKVLNVEEIKAASAWAAEQA